MDFGFIAEQQKFIDEIREFCATTPKGDLADPGDVPDDARYNFSFSFYQRVCDKGWAGLTFPEEYGGRGLGNTFHVIFNEEMQSLGAAISVTSVGNNNWLGSIIAKHGTERQKQEYLTRICRGEIILLCQSFTEPDAGADLASLKTRAVRDGEDYIINGQKMFSSNAHLNGQTTRILLLARTDTENPPEKGISMFLVPPDLPGITIRPLWTDGGGRTNEVFFDNVRVSRESLLGEESGLNRGWDYFREFEWGDWERAPGVFFVVFREILKKLIDFVKTTRMDGRLLSQEPSVRRKIAEIAAGIEIIRLLGYKMAWAQDEGGDVLGAAAVESLVRDSLAVKFPNLALCILGPYGQLQSGSKYAVLNGMLEEMYRLNAFSLFGLVGPLTRKNFIAHHLLDLPQYHGY
ncbi:MAG: acyl-CoA dehydrogenase family protein [Dehalococcoidales bacterium]|nr:acyl-CoA dehydrogenase family protein [Dehalococcoidales bacterium]